MLVLGGDDDQIVPYVACSLKAVKVAQDSGLKVHPGAPHTLPSVLADEVNKAVLEFIKEE